MKNILRICWFIAACLFIIISCSKGDTGDNNSNNGGGNTPTTPTISLSKSSVTFDEYTNDEVVSFSASADWTAEVVNDRADGWLSVSPTSGKAGDASITISANNNDSTDERSASVRIKAGSIQKMINVSQKQKDALTVTASKFEVETKGGEVQIEVKANINFEYEIDASAKDWVKYEGTRAMKTSTLTFKVAENDDAEKREAKITIKSEKFSEEVMIYQSGSEPSIVISQNEYIVSSAGETIAVEVKSNIDVAVELPADADWISENTTRATSTNTYRFDIQPNDSYSQRYAEIKFTNKENNIYEMVKISQAQKDAIILAKSEYEFGVDGGELDFEIQTNVDITVTISNDAKSWITHVETRSLETKTLHFDIATCSADENRESIITISGGNATQTIIVKQSGQKEFLEKERETLIAFYNATGGDNWTNNENWCSDKPVSEWYGVETVSEWHGTTTNGDYVCYIGLDVNNLSGTIGDILKEFSHLLAVGLTGNKLVGELDLSSCQTIEGLSCYDNNITSINVSGCSNLSSLDCHSNLIKTLDVSGCINLTYLQCYLNQIEELNLDTCEGLRGLDCSNNDLTTFEIGNKHNLSYLGCIGNTMLTSFKVSNCEQLTSCLCNFNNIKKLDIENCPNIETLWCHQNSLDELNVTPLTKLKTLWCGNHQSFEGNTISSLDISKNTLLENLSCYGMKLTSIDVSNNPKLQILECSGNPITSLELSALVNLKELWCHSMNLSDNLDVSISDKLEHLSCFNNPNLAKIIISNEQDFSYEKDETAKFCIKGSDILYNEFPYYTSTDYSKDGTVTILQKASVGKGINIVLMGDAFSDRLIDDGTYEDTMKLTMENFFSIEPYTSFRDYFNVYSVTAVSKNEMCSSSSSTALSCIVGNGGDDNAVFAYVQKAISEEQIEDAVIIVILNEPLNEYTYDGLCRLWTPSSATNDYGNGASIAYISRGANDETFEGIIHHEAGGHGFAKLGDEYAQSSDMTDIPNDVIEEIKTLSLYGWLKNIDTTNNTQTVKWSKFLSDSRYSNEQANEDIGIFIGAYGYKYGAYRPSYDSVMDQSLYMGFNAPSREAIYYRIHKLAYGADWQYNYEEFVEWDAKNRATAATTHGIPYRLDIPEDFQPTHPPVIIKSSWREAKNDVPAKTTTYSVGGNAGNNLRKVSNSGLYTSCPITASTVIKSPNGISKIITMDASGKITTTKE